MRYLGAKPRDFLAVATPGAGKTAFALRIAGELLADGTVERLTVVVPTEHLKTQWARTAALVGIALDPKFTNSSAQTSSEYHGGVVVTYAQVASHPTRHRVRTENRRSVSRHDDSIIEDGIAFWIPNAPLDTGNDDRACRFMP